MAQYIWYDGKVVDIIDETPDIKRFFIEIPEVKHFEFKAGQFVMLDLPIQSKITTRPYSISSLPGSGNVMELIIVLNKDGQATPYLFNKVKLGTILKVSNALGKFLLPDKIDKDLCLISTGVGIAPFRAMYLDIYKRSLPHKNIYLVFGTRRIRDLCYHDELVQYNHEHKEFHYIPTLSREASKHWTGRKGYVHEIYRELFHDKRPAYFYICGAKGMIFEARDKLLEMGYERPNIKYELFF